MDHKPDSWEERITLFVGYLIDQNKQSQTVRSYVSAIRGLLAEIKVKLNEDQFLLHALTRACTFKNDVETTRLPISKSVLNAVVQQTYDHFMEIQQPYLAHLYRTLFLTGYYGLFRVGELTTFTHPVLVEDVNVGRNKDKFLFILRSSKTHDQSSRPQSIKISSTPKNPANQSLKGGICCPYQALRKHSSLCPGYLTKSEPFFIFKDYGPVKPIHMRTILKDMLEKTGFDKSLYNCQSLRIGRASDLLKMGVSVESIKRIG